MHNYKTEIINSINEVDRNTWREFFGGHILRRYGYYKTLEESEFDEFKFYYLQIYKDSKLTAIAPLFVMDFPIGFSLTGSLKKISDFINKHFYRLVNIRTVFVGTPSSCYCEIGISPQEENHQYLHKILIYEIAKLAKKEKALLIAFKDYPRKYKNFLEQNRFSELLAYPNVKLDINFSSFEDYLKSLSYKTRYDFRRKLRVYSKLTPISLEVKNDCFDCIDRVYELYLNTVRKNELHFEIVKKQYFINICKNMPEETRFFLWRLDNKLIAFNLCLASGDMLIGDHIGLDYDIAFKYGLYFILFKDKIEWCLNNNIKIFDEGTFSFDPKKRLKFNFYKNYFYMRPRIKNLSIIFKVLSSFFKPEKQDPQLKFLKKFNKI